MLPLARNSVMVNKTPISRQNVQKFEVWKYPFSYAGSDRGPIMSAALLAQFLFSESGEPEAGGNPHITKIQTSQPLI